MKKALTPILAVVAVIAIVFACVFGAQNGSNKSKLDEVNAALNAANDSVKALESEKEKLSADLESAKADLEAKAGEFDKAKADLEAKTGEFDTAKTELEAKVAGLEQKLAKTERALTAAQVAAKSGSLISRCAASAAVRASWIRLWSAWISKVLSLRRRPDIPFGSAMPLRLSRT